MISGVILAAGASSRMGSPKQTITLAGKPMLQHVVDRFLESSLDEVILVLRPNMDWKPASTRRLHVAVNPSSEDGISTSVKAALQSISPKSDAVVIGLGDKPVLQTSTIDSLIRVSKRSGSEILVPTYNGKRGNPILFRRSLFPRLRTLEGDVGAKVLVESKDYSVEEVAVDDIGVLVDVDVPTDIQRVERILSRGSGPAERKPRK